MQQTSSLYTRSQLGTLTLPGTLLLGLFAACTTDGPLPPAPVASVEVAPDAVGLQIDEGRQLSATLRTAGGTAVSGPPVAWSSSDTLVAAVSSGGLVTARGVGTATITATSEGKHGRAQITVAPGAVESVALNTTAATIEEGDRLQLTATPRDARQNPVSGLFIHWTSSDESIAQISVLGQVTGMRPGTVTITARAHGKEASATVTVNASYEYDLLYSGWLAHTNTPELFRLDMRAAEGQPERFLVAGALLHTARYSPDGRRIAFTGSVGGVTGIYVANRDGSGLRPIITSEQGEVGAHSWSPDGTRIVFMWRRAGEQNGQIWVGNVDGELNPVSLTADLGDARVRMPTWSPLLADGTSRIAYVHQINGVVTHIWTMRPDGSDKRQVTTGDFHDDFPAWSPNGETIVFERINHAGSALWLVGGTGGNARSLLQAGLPGRQVSPAWSPDGKLIAFASQHETYASGSNAYRVYTVWADGTRLVRRSPGETNSGYPVWIPRR